MLIHVHARRDTQDTGSVSLSSYQKLPMAKVARDEDNATASPNVCSQQCDGVVKVAQLIFVWAQWESQQQCQRSRTVQRRSLGQSVYIDAIDGVGLQSSASRDAVLTQLGKDCIQSRGCACPQKRMCDWM